MTQIDTVLLKVSSRCNIRCDYCYIYQMGDTGWMKMPKGMSQETISATIDALKSLAETQNKGFAVVLHGGEPLALGKENLTFLLKGLRATLPAECKLSMQTNGTLLTKSILDLCSETQTTIAVSLDGPEHIHNSHRLDANGQGTFERTIAGIQLLQSHPDKNLFAGILTVIDPQTKPEEIYTFFKQLEVPS
ncbi:MAG: radical SAM protein, partial [Phormidesmis sp. CAN_BIN44]|nr:radical SAM protein [Phormidesmis sp. CAN_BIN44]